MERKINSTFQDHGHTLKVLLNKNERTITLKFNQLCNLRCYYRHNGICDRWLRNCGDCQAEWREDHTPVYFQPIDE